MAFELPPLPYDHNALEPHIEEATMHIHHGKHHATYVAKLNAAIEDHPNLQQKPLEELIGNPGALPEEVRQAVINHGGGVWNHTFFWESLAGNAGGTPNGKIAEALTKSFGNFDSFKEQFATAAVSLFGSGWTWLCAGDGGKLIIKNLPNQDSPLAIGLKPLLVIDVWEHAYYLQYQNRRPEFIGAFWNIVNWSKAEQRYAAVL